MPNTKSSEKYTLMFKELSSKDLPVVGGKGANLGEMTNAGVPVPPGFVVTTRAYNEFLDEAKIRKPITDILKRLDVNDTKALNDASRKIKKLITSSRISIVVQKAVEDAYKKMSGFTPALVAVRSSATAEDIPTASFAGQQATFLNVKGNKHLVNSVRECWASLFEPRAIFYREEHGFEHMKVSIAVPVQKMIQSESSGVMFTLDPVTNDESKVVIEAVYGLGEAIVSGAVTPDNYVVDKENLKVVDKHVAKQEWMLVRRGKVDGGEPNVKVKVSLDWQNRQKLADKHIRDLARIGRKIEKHYKFPQDIEWAFAGNKLWIVQSRPVTTLETPEEKKRLEVEERKEATRPRKKEKVKMNILIEGVGASPGVLSGKVRVIKGPENMGDLKKDEILVTGMTTPSWVPIMKKASAIITDQGGTTAHAAIVSRELGIPCVVGTQIATQELRTGSWVTIDGGGGRIYEGKLKEGATIISEIEREEVELPASKSFADQLKLSEEELAEHKKIKTATKLFVNLGEPDLAKPISKMHIDGVGLLRAEFMLATFGVHPQKALKNKKTRKKFVDHLVDGVSSFCEEFGPDRPIIYRTTDFKTNEYAALEGGAEFEFEEYNPMIGFRGVSRYLEDPEVFKMELEAIRKVRNVKGHKNLWMMLPFVRTVDELIEAKKIVSRAGLRRSSTFKLYMMVEIPSNVILIEDFIKAGIDGVSMGTNDLTQLTLGIDRDNPMVQKVFDERNEAVLWSMERVVKAANKHKINSSICGQAPSVYPEITKKLVEWGITSISVNADVAYKTREIVADVEKKMIKRKR